MRVWARAACSRAMSAVRSFFRHLAREKILDNPAPRAVRTPHLRTHTAAAA